MYLTRITQKRKAQGGSAKVAEHLPPRDSTPQAAHDAAAVHSQSVQLLLSTILNVINVSFTQIEKYELFC